MGKSQRDKGNREERYIVQCLRDAGHSAERVPLSGAAGGSFADDIRAVIRGIYVTIEAKARKNGTGFALLYRWLGNADILTVRADRQERLYVVPEKVFLKLIGERDGTSGSQDAGHAQGAAETTGSISAAKAGEGA